MYFYEKQEKEYKTDKKLAQLKLLSELNDGRKSGEKEEWISAEDVRNHFKENK